MSAQRRQEIARKKSGDRGTLAAAILERAAAAEAADPALAALSTTWDFFSRQRDLAAARKASGPRHVPPPTEAWGPKARASAWAAATGGDAAT